MTLTVRTRIGLVAAAAVLAVTLGGAVLACGEPVGLTRAAISADPAESGPAIAALRQRGPAGLRALMNAYGAEVARHTRGNVSGATPQELARWKRIGAAIDGVAAQKDAAA